MSGLLGVRVEPAADPKDVLRGADIVVTATTSSQPVFDGRDLETGAHVNAIGSNSLLKREVDATTLTRAGRVVVDSIEQAKLESGDLLEPIEKGLVNWEQLRELRQVVVGETPGRRRDDEITLFESHGLAIEDLAVAARVLDLAKAQGIGVEVPI